MTKRARFLMHFVLFYTCIEGLLVNIWYPSLVPYLCKDLAILVVYFLVFSGNPGKLFTPSPALKRLALPLLFFSAITGLYLLMPGTNLLGGAVALKQRLFYIPLMSIGYFFIRADEDLERLIRVLSLYAIGVSAFGIYLYFTGPSGLTRLGANYSAVLFTPGSRLGYESYWRVPGTFTSPGQFGVYLLFNGLMAGALLITPSVSKRRKAMLFVSIGLTLLAMLSSGSRTTFLLLSASMAALVVASRKLKRIVAGGLTAYAALAFSFVLLGQGVLDRVVSIADYRNLTRFQDAYSGQLFLPALLENPIGSGLGLATTPARHFLGSGEFQLVESYFGILAVETGVLGVSTFAWVAVAIVALILRLRKYVKGSSLALIWYGLAIHALFIILTLPGSSMIDNAPGNLYFWFSIGLLARAAESERQKRLAAQPAGRAPSGRTSLLTRRPWM